jgi:hypothetical protein
MTRKRKVGISVAFIVVLAIVVSVYTSLYGTFWGRAAAEKQIMNSVRQKYGQEKFHQVGYAYYDFEWSKYEVNIVFDQLPQFLYSFGMQNGKAVLTATSGNFKGENAPDPPLKFSSFPNTKILGTIEDTWAGSSDIDDDYDRWYIITPRKVGKIGTKFKVISGDTPPTTSGVWSDVLPKGEILYKIPNASPTQKIAVLWKGQYVEALRVNHYSQ